MAKERIEVEFCDEKPAAIIWKDGRRFKIKKVLYECENKPKNVRYTVLVGKNEERYLYLTPGGNFIERT